MAACSGRAVRVAILNDFEIVNAGVDALLAEHRDRVHVVDLDTRDPDLSQVDIVLFDPFAPATEQHVDVYALARKTDAKLVAFTWTAPEERLDTRLPPETVCHLSKTLSAGEIVTALESVRDGRRVHVPASPGCHDAQGLPCAHPEVTLTDREAQMIGFITAGLSNQEMADRAYLSINSVKTYIRTAYRKIGVNRRSQAVSWGVRHGYGTEPTPLRSR